VSPGERVAERPVRGRPGERDRNGIAGSPVAQASKPLKAGGLKTRPPAKQAATRRPLNGLNTNPVDFHDAHSTTNRRSPCSSPSSIRPRRRPDFPAGIRVGMTPLSAWSAPSHSSDSKPRTRAQGLVAELPAEAYGEVMNAFKANPGGAGGIKPESIETSAGLAYYTMENATDGTTNVRAIR